MDVEEIFLRTNFWLKTAQKVKRRTLVFGIELKNKGVFENMSYSV